ncbi:hypothetical protein [Yersinia ruckeri]|nr:hypothetical protein [Yersinia ruckeri]EEP98313.1 hypothetical protein yruck0001_11380 [Yersinia ruckeri ATCC 29473]MCW6603018.1 hypothetical protein [Yersinia ruckeri]UIM86402.1 hypothetical protein LGL93_09730 [Yersinia ruckeri]UZY06771.1 hypothetical protein LNQ40_010110 [Yersinia ruckeri]
MTDIKEDLASLAFGGLVVWWFGGEVSDIGDIIRFSLLARIMPLTSG